MAWDDFLDDLQDKAEEAFSNVSSVAISDKISGFLKIGQPPKSNLTGKQIADGERGQAPNNIVYTQTPPINVMDKVIKFGPWMIVAIFVAIALFFRRK